MAPNFCEKKIIFVNFSNAFHIIKILTSKILALHMFSGYGQWSRNRGHWSPMLTVTEWAWQTLEGYIIIIPLSTKAGDQVLIIKTYCINITCS